MLNQNTNDDGSFATRLMKAQSGMYGDQRVLSPPELSQWLEYWNDADSITSNLRKVEHWLLRARQQHSV